MLSQADQQRIAEAVAKAEQRTSGEIVCVVIEEASAYREVPLAWAAAAALALPPLAVTAGLSLDGATAALGGWQAAHGPQAGPALGIYALIQLALFMAVGAMVSIPAVRRRLTPRGLKQERVRREALQQLAAARARLPADHTAVVIVAALKDRQIDIVADAAIHARVGQPLWDRAMREALAAIRAEGPAAGLIKAVEICAAAMAEHFPDDGRANVYPDAVVEL